MENNTPEQVTGRNPDYVSKQAHDTFESRHMGGEELLAVGFIKSRAAALYDAINEISVPPGNTEAGRLIALAKTELESSVMWATKAVSRTVAGPSQ